MRKPTQKSLTNKLDKICSEITRSRGKCCRCGCANYDKLDCAHIYSRSNRAVRWDLLNILCLCDSCHFWAHANPTLFGEFVREFLGEYNYELLKSRARSTKKWMLCEKQELYDALSSQKVL